MIAVFWKEWRDLLRDRKTLFTLILLPMLMTPVLMAAGIGAGYLASQKSDAERYTYRWQDAPVIEFDQRLQDSELFTPADNNGIADIELSGTGTQIMAMFDTGEITSPLGRRLRSIISDLNDETRTTMLAQYELTMDQLEPWQIEEASIDGTSEAESIGSEIVGLILPLLLFISVLATSMSISGDLVAGERERNTLETLLSTPISATHMLLGKWLMLSSTGISSAVLMILSLSIFIVPAKLLIPAEFADVLAVWSPTLLITCLVLALPITVLIAGLLLAVTRSAKTFKEAQSQATVVFLVIYLPMMFAMQGLFDPTFMTMLIPVLNYTVAIQALTTGELLWWMPVLALASNLIAAGAVGLIYAAKVSADDLLNAS